ncbi:AraC family transcriptional regulator [Fulvivirgaceae bacterium BMA10]|uniref:AraC family transcriptional regulator n=1 Tax=Splendidivirga corallicola TaxID=3051826 RepID=A0ABT8KSF5_9BACT|nr:AraC family transcriptional regulator [Fulvivirgaceae bacterium BMA10]
MYKSLKSISLSLLNIGHVPLDHHWDFDDVISPFTRMYYIDGGNAKVYHSGKVFDLKPGYLYLIPSYTYSRYKCDDYMSQYYISFFEEIGNGLSIYNLKEFRYEVKAKDHDLQNFKRLLELNPDRALVNDDPKVYDNHPTLLSFEKRNEDMTAAALLETQGILLSLLSRFVLDKNIVSNNDSLTDQKITESIYYINENLEKALTVDMLASKSHLNTDYYSRAFKDLFGIRPVNYIQAKRIERAQLLLATTTNTIPEIASKIGLLNLSYFSRLFKKHTGKSPGEFRKHQWKV